MKTLYFMVFIVMPNARLQARLEAGAERTL
jgi:hypothetical protein